MIDHRKAYQRAHGRANNLLLNLQDVDRSLSSTVPNDGRAQKLAQEAKTSLEQYRRYLLTQSYILD